jgi:hypothetical protein
MSQRGGEVGMAGQAQRADGEVLGVHRGSVSHGSPACRGQLRTLAWPRASALIPTTRCGSGGRSSDASETDIPAPCRDPAAIPSPGSIHGLKPADWCRDIGCPTRAASHRVPPTIAEGHNGNLNSYNRKRRRRGQRASQRYLDRPERTGRIGTSLSKTPLASDKTMHKTTAKHLRPS